MTKYNFLLALLLVLLLNIDLFAGTPNWTVNSSSYSNTMTITGVVKLNYIEQKDENDVLAAFVNGECRGVTSPIFIESENKYMAFLLVYSNVSSEEEITFKFYDQSNDAVVELKNKTEFKQDENKGSITAPHVFMNTTPGANFKSFAFQGINATAIIDSTLNKVEIEVPVDTDVTALIPTFTLSEGALATVNGILQESNVTNNNFSQSVVYNVEAVDRTVKAWTINVTINNPLGDDDTVSKGLTKIYPIPAKEVVQITWTENVDIKEINLYDINGKKVCFPVLSHSKTARINISNLPAGIYVLPQFNRKLIKE